jgi:FMN phosphatase YigB (HAD superfamily)
LQPLTKVQLDDIKLVSWDVDGTMYSLRKARAQLRREFLKRILTGKALSACRELMLMRSHRAEIETARKGGGKLSVARSAEVSEIEERWYGAAIGRIGPMRGLREVISFLQSRQIPQVIVSDYAAGYKLQSLEVINQFAAIYVGEELGFVKPSPVLFERVSVDFSIPFSSILHLGDRSDTDGAAATAAGCRCLILGRDFSSFEELLGGLRNYTHSRR